MGGRAHAQIEDSGDRHFSFYPPILNVEHNDWVFVRSTWSEILVRNPKLDVEVWIARSYLGEVSPVDEPVRIVGLRRELVFEGGSVWPHERRLVAMPRAATMPRPGVEGVPAARPPSRTLRGDFGAESRIGRLILASLGIGILACFAVISFFRRSESGGNVQLRPLVQLEINLTAGDDYFAVVRKLGEPSGDRWLSDSGERQYRALTYPNLTVILMGPDRQSMTYIGAKDKDWKNIHSVNLPGGQNSSSMMRSLKRF
ncbi:MAG: hypothetical protein ACRD44_01170 [Bryobacteraceae bacterium]